MYKLLFLLVFLVGCNSEQNSLNTSKNLEDPISYQENTSYSRTEYKLIIHNSIPSEKINDILDAASQWNTASNGTVVLVPSIGYFDKSKTSIEDGVIGVFLSDHNNSDNPRTIGLTWAKSINDKPISSVIWISDSLNDMFTYFAAMHEIGHALGLKHYDGDAKSIMHPVISSEQKPTCIDVLALCNIWKCRPICGGIK